MNRYYSFLFLILSFSNTALFAQKSLSWDEAIELIHQNNPELHALNQRVQAGHWVLEATKGRYHPSLNARLGASKQGSNQPQSETQTSYSAGLELRQNLFSGLSDQASVKQARADYEIVQNQRARLLTRLERDLRTSFANLSYASQAVVLFEQIATRREENLRLVELRFEGGSENKGSVLLSQANLQQSKYDTLRARQDLITSQKNLSRILGVEGQDSYSLASLPPEVALDEPLNLNQLAQAHLDLTQEEQRIERSKAAITQSKSHFYPTLDLQAGLSRNDQVFFPERESWSVGLSLSVPLYDGRRDFYQARSAFQQLEASLQDRRAAKYRIEDEINQNAYHLMSLKERLKVEESFLKAAEVRAEISRERYNSGLLSFEDWLNIENDYANRIRNTLTTQRDYYIAQANWIYALGEVSPSFINRGRSNE